MIDRLIRHRARATFRERRVARRVCLTGDAFWSGSRVEGSGRLRNISAGGVRVSDAKPLLPKGSQLDASFVIGIRTIDGIPVEVAWTNDQEFGLRFRRMGDAVGTQMIALLRDLTICPDPSLYCA